jgi:6-phosphofructokinase 1
MARHAVHAGMAGKTGVMIGFEHNYYVNVPIPAVVSQTKAIEVSGDLWRAVLQATAQPRW